MSDSTPSSSALPSKAPSIGLGVAVYTVLSLALAFAMARSGGQAMQAALGCFACLVILAGPLASVWHYTETHRLTLLAGQGAGLGAIVGACGAVAAGLLQQLLILAGVLPSPAEALERQREQMLSQGMDPEQVAQGMAFAEQMAGLSENVGVGLLVGAVIGAVVGALGGALGAVLFKKGPATA